MSIIKAYINGWKNWNRWDGRTRRRDYWAFTLCNYFILFALFSLTFIIENAIPMILFIAYLLILLVPNLAITLRRLHDTNHGALYLFVSWVPVIGNLWFWVLMLSKGNCGSNDYGIDSKEFDNGTGITTRNYNDTATNA